MSNSSGKCICLLCDNVISQFKKSNFQRHPEAKHPSFSTNFQRGGQLKAEKLARLKQSWTALKTFFHINSSEMATWWAVCCLFLFWTWCNTWKSFRNDYLFTDTVETLLVNSFVAVIIINYCTTHNNIHSLITCYYYPSFQTHIRVPESHPSTSGAVGTYFWKKYEG